MVRHTSLGMQHAVSIVVKGRSSSFLSYEDEGGWFCSWSKMKIEMVHMGNLDLVRDCIIRVSYIGFAWAAASFQIEVIRLGEEKVRIACWQPALQIVLRCAQQAAAAPSTHVLSV